MSDLSEAPAPNALPPTLVSAWLRQTHDLLVLTDAAGCIRWANPAFMRAAAMRDGVVPATLAGCVQAGADASLAGVAAALQGPESADTELCLRATDGGSTWVQARVSRMGDELLWTLNDITAQKRAELQSRHQADLLETAQEFGRLGVWERDVRSGEGRWDRHVFKFWGLDAEAGTPSYDEAVQRIHPDDVKALLPRYSDCQPGRYSERYRVVHPDGGVRWIHSQWQVKRGVDGQPDREVGIMVDDTEAHELARSLDSTTAQLKLAVDMGRIVVWRHDLASNRVYYNEHGFAVLGIAQRPDGLTLAEVRALTHPDDIPRIKASAERATATGLPVDVEIRYRRSDGTWRYMLTRRNAERSAGGELTGFVGLSLDVTEQVGQLRRAEQLATRLEAAATAARLGIWATTIGTAEVEWNARMYELFDMVGEARPPVLGAWLQRCVHPDDTDRVKRAIKTYMVAGLGDFEIEFRTRHRNGGTRWMVLRSSIERGAGDTHRLFGIAMDVTARHEATAALHAASERAALIARSAGIGTWEIPDDHTLTLWDDQMFLLRGLAPRSVALDREERLALVHPDDLDRVIDSAAGPAVDSPVSAYEFRVRHPDGSYRWLASRSALLKGAHGHPAKRVGVNWDITENKSAELARQQAALAERSSQAKSQFLSRVSHELRTPLNAVLGFTQLLQRDARQAEVPGQLDKLGHIRAAGEHLLTLINDVLDLSSLEAGTLRLDLQPVALAVTVREALPLVQQLAAEHGVSLHTGPLAGTAHTDPTRLRQVLLNLLTNAIKYNRPGGEVVVEARLDGPPGRVVLRVRDNGRGMSADQLAHLFEPFNRLGVDVEGISGSGIGLTIAKSLVEGMQGRISATSRPGHGTVFEVDLPARSAPAETPAAPEAPVAPSVDLRPERSGQLLYIEDNEVNVLLVEEMVRNVPGLRIVSELTGAAGVVRAASLQPDLILVDMQLPDFDGFEVLRRLRAEPATAATRCIALSANAMPEDIARALSAGFDDYWTKPIKFKEFLQSLQKLFPVR